MRYVRLTVDGAGETHFVDDEMDLKETEFRSPAPYLFVSRPYELNVIEFIRLPPGWVGESITVPNMQFVICLAGAFEITVSDGEHRTFRTGDVVLMEDTRGKGHSTRVESTKECFAVVAPVLEWVES